MQEYMDHVNLPIKQAFRKFEELTTTKELQELNKAVDKLNALHPSMYKIHSADSKSRRRWPDINKESDKMMPRLYKVINSEHTEADSTEVLEAFYDLHRELQICLFYFFWFPEMAIINKRVMIYLWMARPYLIREIDEDYANEIFDELIAKGFVEPIYQKCSLVPDSCRMSRFVRSLLHTEMAKRNECLPNYISNRFCAVVMSTIEPYSCLINVSEPIIDVKPELFEKMKQVKALYLGRWQNSPEHHIEVTDIKILYGLKNMNDLMFLSLCGISLITELPSFISELTSLRILDLRACPNLEGIPDRIGLLENLTHLDMSDCYFLEHMPKSLANLSRLKVLKGFHIGDSKYNEGSCTLKDLSRLQRLTKLNIYTSMKEFPTESHLSDLQQFRELRKLTISWGGCSSLGENDTNQPPQRSPTIQSDKAPPSLPSKLQKLDLQCLRGTLQPSWLRPANLSQLKKLYIKGGKLQNLFRGRYDDPAQWNVEILRLKYLSELLIRDSSSLKILFPKLIYLQKVDCPRINILPYETEWYV